MRIGIIFILGFWVWAGMAQGNLSGRVVEDTGEGIFAANVYWKGAMTEGTTTDLDGNFQLNLRLGDTLVCSFIGYDQWQRPASELALDAPLTIELRQSGMALQAILVTGSDPIAAPFSAVELEPLDIYLNPLAQADPLKAITALPASTNTEESANPSLRGSAADRSLVVFNGVPINNPVRNTQLNGLGNFSLFNTALLKSQQVYASNPPLTYGNSTAGLIELNTRDELDANTLQLSTTLASLGVMVEQKVSDQAFFQAYGNYQFADAFIDLNRKSLPELKDFGNVDGGLNWRFNGKKGWAINGFSYGIDEFYEAEISSFTYNGLVEANRQRHFHILNVEHKGEQDRWTFHQGLNRDKSQFEFGNIEFATREWQWYQSINYKSWAIDRWSWQTGITFDQQWYQSEGQQSEYFYAIAPTAPTEEQSLDLVHRQLEGYVFANWEVDAKYLWSMGFRMNVPLGGQGFFTSAQSSLRYYINSKQSLLFSLGRYSNYARPGFQNPAFARLTSDQLAIDYQLELDRSQFQAAIFTKNESGATFNDFESQPDQVWMLGVEAFWQQELNPHFQFSLANTFLIQQIQQAGNTYNGRRSLPYFIKAQLLFNHPKLFQASLSWVARPGLRFTPITNSIFRSELDVYEPIYDNSFNSERYPNYEQMSIGLSRFFQFPETSLLLFINLANALDHPNPAQELYESDYQRAGYQYYTRRTLYFGVVWQWYR